MKFIAHRGESVDAPENTMAAFKLAWKHNTDGIEGDFHKLADGRIACMHDRNAKRTTGTDADICTLTYAELKKLDAGSWKDKRRAGEKVPLLDEIFSALPRSCVLYAEVKDDADGIIEMIKKLMGKYKIKAEQLIIISFSETAILRASRLLPESKRFLLTGLRYDRKSGFSPTADELIERLKRFHADGVDCQYIAELDTDYISRVKNSGFEFHVWTINDFEQAHRMIAAGVDSITSDCAAKLKKHFRGI
ncbi:MAG: glycerophosphodiester phosphodiesterase family protein [Victivallales bacterium]|nr:glycerophosphodiester phosphodiesterase family protein [Victivallales bacterium]